jgi:hypothetical protein
MIRIMEVRRPEPIGPEWRGRARLRVHGIVFALLIAFVLT